MRSDMSKVVVERRRLGQMKKVKHFREKQSTKNNLEDAPTKEPLRSKREAVDPRPLEVDDEES
jgi:hypothetical protein